MNQDSCRECYASLCQVKDASIVGPPALLAAGLLKSCLCLAVAGDDCDQAAAAAAAATAAVLEDLAPV